MPASARQNNDNEKAYYSRSSVRLLALRWRALFIYMFVYLFVGGLVIIGVTVCRPRRQLDPESRWIVLYS